MDNPRVEKVAVVDEVRERLSGSTASVVTEYRGLTVTELAVLRHALASVGGDYKVFRTPWSAGRSPRPTTQGSSRCSSARPPSPSSTGT